MILLIGEVIKQKEQVLAEYLALPRVRAWRNDKNWLFVIGIRWAPILQKQLKMGTLADVAELADAQASGACAP